MKKIHFFIALSAPIFILWCCTSSTAKENEKQKLNSSSAIGPVTNNIAVFELFTSQGCSSCPPADKLIGSYTSKTNVIPLSFHVDYWDRLGWKDAFSAKEYSQRQYKYASALKADVYTPQLIVNGQVAMIGSDAGKIAAILSKILSEQPVATLSLQKPVTENGNVNVRYEATGNTKNAILHIAVVEKKAVTTVKGGENMGATLTDYNVVRNFKTIDSIVNGENMASINFPPSLDFNNRSVILFLQEKRDNKIIAAAKADF